MSITIDGKTVEIAPSDKSIVDIADRAEVRIPAPCYRGQRRAGCCRACVVEVDAEQKFACTTAPENGMNVVVDRADLKELRKQRLIEYRDGVQSGTPCECDCSCESDCCE